MTYLVGDPWDNYKALQPASKQSTPAAQAPSMMGNAPTPARQVDAPIAAKFTALESRIATFEASLQEIHNEQQHVTAAVEHSAQQAASTEAKVVNMTLRTISKACRVKCKMRLSRRLPMDMLAKRSDWIPNSSR